MAQRTELAQKNEPKKIVKPEVKKKEKNKMIKEIALIQEKEEDEDSTPDGQEFELAQEESDVNTQLPQDLEDQLKK